VSLRGSVTHFLQGLAAGEGRREWELGGKLDGFVDVDASKLGLWSGLSLHSHAELNYGEALTSPGGTFLPTNVGMGFPGTESASGDLALFLAQQLPGGVRVMAGKINTVDLYSAGREFSGGRGVERFHHLEFAAPASGITPSMILGGVVSIPAEPAKFTLMIYDPDSKIGQTAMDRPFEKGTSFNGSVELGGTFMGRKSRHILSAAYSTQDGVDFEDIPELLLPRSTPVGSRDNRWFLSYAVEQTVWRDEAVPARAWGLFGQAAISDANPNPIGWSALAGVGGTGVIPGRERDRFGAGVFCLGFSESLKEGLDAVGIPLRNEAGLEVFYNLEVTRWMYLTGDVMVIRPPRPGADAAVLGGVRAQVVF
jgi:porin